MRPFAAKPGRLWTAWTGWRARRVSDPVERLRLLRHTVGDRRLWPADDIAGGKRQLRWRVWVLAAGALVLAPLGAMKNASWPWERTPLALAGTAAPAEDRVPDVWLVEETPAAEQYSNGLRIERKYETANEPRRYEVYALGRENEGPVEERTAPAGIVFHSTESATAEFRADQTPRLKRIGKFLLEYVRQERAYHYLIDRFGRVWRIVRESDAANHAGYSVWADDRWTYLNLNWSFLGISLEGRSSGEEAGPDITDAQVLALRQLVAMLRSRYAIAARNCVTHAQVSVNPSNMQAGYHYDWATRFPYARIGLPDNYRLPAPSLWLFGFTYDPSLVVQTGESYWLGLTLGDDRLRQRAASEGATVEACRAKLAANYRRLILQWKARMEAARGAGAPEASVQGARPPAVQTDFEDVKETGK